MKMEDEKRLTRIENAAVRWMCRVTLSNRNYGKPKRLIENWGVMKVVRIGRLWALNF